MAPLAALREAGIAPELLDLLIARRILTLEAFLAEDLPAELTALARPVAASAPLRQALVAVLDHVAAHHAGQWLSGASLLPQAQVHSTGCQSLDELLQGGLREGTVTELVGSAASGKTQVCLQSSAAAALCGGAVAYIDTGGFSAQRTAHIVGALAGGPARIRDMKADVSRAMRAIVRMRAFSLPHLLALLEDLSAHCCHAAQKSDFFAKVRLLVVDSPSALVGALLGGSHTQGHALMMCLSRTLKRMATEHKLAVLITNHTVAGEGGKPKPALGESWKAAPHVRVLLQRDVTSAVCTASLLKHSSAPAGCTAHFCITRGGLEPCDPPTDPSHGEAIRD